jgi:hypothetical protein
VTSFAGIGDAANHALQEALTMRPTALSHSARFMLLVLALAVPARAAGAQSLLERIKKKAEEASRAADAVKRKADSIAAVTAAAQQAGSARGSQGANAGNAASPMSAGGGAPATGTRPLSRSAAKVDAQVMLASGMGPEYVLSPRGLHVAAKALRGSRTAVSYDGVVGPPFDELADVTGTVAFSEDGSRYAYVGRLGQQWVVMADGKEVGRGAPFRQPASGNKTLSTLGFSPGGKHLYYMTADEPQSLYTFYWDGKPDPMPGRGAQPVFSADGEHYAYEFGIKQTNGEIAPALMVDGHRASYPGSKLQWTADDHLYSSVAMPGNGIAVLLDGKPIMRVPGYELLVSPYGPLALGVVLSVPPQGERFWFLTLNGRRVPNSECHGTGNIDGGYFSPDGKHWAIRCQDAPGVAWVMVDGHKGQDYQGVMSIVSFTADGRAIYLATANRKQFVIVGDHEYGPYTTVLTQSKLNAAGQATSQILPARVVGNHFGFVAYETNGPKDNLVVVDGKSYHGEYAQELTFNADGSHFAYFEGLGKSPTVTLDGVHHMPLAGASEIYEVTQKLIFSPDGKHLAYSAFSHSAAQPHAVAIDDGMFLTDATSIYDVSFSPDSKHLMWLGHVNGSSRQRVFVDGQPVLEFDQHPGTQRDLEPWWNVWPDGSLGVIAQDGSELKRFRIVPGSGSIEAKTMAR